MVEDNLIKISSHWIEWMSMSNKEITPDLYVSLLVQIAMETMEIEKAVNGVNR